jgi:Domain of unknown function (DUF3127)
MSQLTIKARLQRDGFNPKSFPSKSGQQNTMDFLIEWTERDYAKQLVVTACNKTIEEMADAIDTGERTFHIEATSRETNGKWYTSIKVWSVS